MEKWIKLDSSVISAVAYEKNTLKVIFTSRAAYIYQDVPQEVYQALLNASSHGHYFTENIRGKYPYKEI